MEIRDEARGQPVRLNFAALFALSVVIFIWIVIWIVLSPILLPVAACVVSFLQPAFWFLCALLLVLNGVLMFGFGLAVVGLLLGGTIPRFKGF
jgi:uncharacterized membrane protein